MDYSILMFKFYMSHQILFIAIFLSTYMTGNLLFFTVLALNVHLQMFLTLILRITLITDETIYRICYLISVKFGVKMNFLKVAT